MVIEGSREWRRRILDVVDLDLIEDSRVKTILEAAREIDDSAEGTTDFLGDLVHRTAQPDLGSLVAELSTAPMPEVTDETIRCQLKLLLEHQDKERSRRLAPLIAEAEARGDLAELDRLLGEKARLRQKNVEI